jgi:hypothetical protein
VDVPDEALDSVALGFRHACGVTPGGELRCWGACEYGSCDAPAAAPSTAFTSVVSGHDFSCAMTAAAEVTCWGLDTRFATETPDELAQATQAWAGRGPYLELIANPENVCGWMADGTLRCYAYPYGYEVDWGPAVPDALDVAPFDAAWAISQLCWLDAEGRLDCGDILGPDNITDDFWTALQPYRLADIASAHGALCGLTTDAVLACSVHSDSLHPCPFCAVYHAEQ